MKPSHCPELIAEMIPPEILTATLTATLTAARHRRNRRAAGRAVLLLGLMLMSGTVLSRSYLQKHATEDSTVLAPSLPDTVIPEPAAPAFLLVKSSPRGTVRVTTTARAGWNVPEQTVALRIRTADSPSAPHASDSALLAAAAGRPAALCRFPDGRAEFVLLDSAAK